MRFARYAGHSDTLEVVETFGRAVDERLDTRAVLEIILVKLRERVASEGSLMRAM